jgi:hypothetical protein
MNSPHPFHLFLGSGTENMLLALEIRSKRFVS